MIRSTSLTAVPVKAVMGKKALIAMSGGVDFSVAAFAEAERNHRLMALAVLLFHTPPLT